MTIRGILDPFISHKAVHDLEALKKRATEGDWSEMLRHKWVVIVDVLPGTAAKSIGYLTNIYFHFIKLHLSQIFTDIKLAANQGMQAFGYAVILMPSRMGKMGYALVESCKRSETKLLISQKIEEIFNESQSSWARDSVKVQVSDAVERLRSEMRTLGYLTSDSLDELNKAIKLMNYSKLKELRSMGHALCVQAAKLSPDVETMKTEIHAVELKDESLLLREREGKNHMRTPSYDLERLFSVIHGDFTGSSLNPPTAEHLANYLLKLIGNIRTGKKAELHAIFSQDLKHLDQLERRLKTLAELEMWRSECENDHVKFGQKVLEKLAIEKTVSLASGYVGVPVGHRTYITFNLEERKGKQWVSGKVTNLGEGSEEGVFDDEFGRLRVHPEQILNPVPIEEVQKSFFWRTFLNLSYCEQSDGTAVELSIEDFNERLLKQWPGGVGSFVRRGKKPQYSGSCEFASLCDVIQEILGSKYSRPFLLGLYDAVLEDYAQERGVTERNYHALKEVSSHLARAAARSFAANEGLAASIQKKLAVLDQGIRTFEKQREVSCAKSQFPCMEPLREDRVARIQTSSCSIHTHDKVVLSPPEGSLKDKLQYFIDEGKNYRYSGRDMLCILRRGIELLPSIKDPIWETGEVKELLGCIKQLKRALLERLNRKKGSHRHLNLGSDDAALLLKVIALELKAYPHQVGMKEVRDFFLSRMKAVLESQRLYLMRPIHPDRMRDYRESVDFILEEASDLKVADNISLMKISVSSLDALKRYPHLNFLYEYLQTHPAFHQDIKNKILQQRLKVDPPITKPVTDLDCVIDLLIGSRYSMNEDVKEWQGLFQSWGDFFSLFGLRASAYDYYRTFSYYAFEVNGTYYFEESFSSVYNSKRGYSDAFPQTSDKEACQTDLFLETYPNIEGKEAQKLLPILKKELPFNHMEKVHENQHLLHNDGIEIEEEGMPFYELQSLFGITTYKDLSVDLLVKHFDRYFPRMRKQVFCTFFQALLTQVFIERGNTHSLLENASQDHPEQVFQLLDFLQKRRINAKQYNWDQTTSFLFWMEGVALSYLIRYQKDNPQVETAYQNYLMQTRFMFEREEDPELILELSSRLMSLKPYFEGTSKNDSFGELINRVVAGISDTHERPLQETRRMDHGFVTHLGDVERTTLENRKRVVNTESFHGVYRRIPNLQLTNSQVDTASFPFPYGTYLEEVDLEVYRQGEQILIFKGSETLPSYCLDSGRIELLEKGKRTGLYLATETYKSQMGTFFDRIAVPSDLYIWKNARNEVIRVDYKKLGLSFNYESDPEDARVGRWMSSTHVGYYLDPSYKCYEFEPSSHYLVLRNHKGQRIAFVLDAQFEDPGIAQSLTSRASFTVDKKKAQSLLVYHLDEAQEIDFSRLGHEELIYGMYLALQEKDYEKVGRWLKEWEKQDPLHTQESVQLLKYFVVGREKDSECFDKNPRSLAVRLKLMLSLFNDPLYTLSEEERKEWEKDLVRDGINYRSQQNNVFPFKLSDDQLKQLDERLPSNFLFFISAQVQSLMQKISAFYKGVDLNTIPFDTIPISKDSLKEMKGIDNALRPYEPFTQNFFAYYHLAKTADPADSRLEELRYLLKACKSDTSNKVQMLREILQGVLDHPFAFPPAEELLVLRNTFSAEKVFTQLYNDAKQANFTSFLFEGTSIIYKAIKMFAQQTYETHKAKIALWTTQLLIVLFIMRIPSRFLGPFAELCEERYFGLFFRSLIGALIKPAIEWSAKEIEKLKDPILDRIWTRETKKSPFIQPTVPDKIFTPSLVFNSQLDAPLETFLRLQNSEEAYLIPERHDMSEALEALEDIEKTFTKDKGAKREPCVQRQHDKFLEGLQQKRFELEKLRNGVKYQIDRSRIGVCLKAVAKEKERFLQISREKESLILRIAHNYSAKLQLEVKGGLLQALSLDELIVAFGQKDHAKIMRSHPGLLEEQLTRLEQLIGEYLVAKTAADRLEVVCEKLTQAKSLHARSQETRGRFRITNTFYSWRGQYHDPEKDQREINALLADCMQILETKRCFSGAQNPHLLVFEYFMKLTLRENQVAFLDRLTKAMGDPKALENILEEAHTGFGKSKVAIPLWLFLTSRAGRLAMITVPEPLLEEMRVHLKRVLGKNFDQGITPIYFDRTRANDLKYLQYINKTFTDAEEKGKCVVISINSLHGIAVLKHKETYFKQTQEGLPPKYLQELDRTRKILAERVSNFVDEASDSFYIRYSYDYSVGRKKPLASSYIEATREMYDLLVEDDELLRKIDFDFMRQTETGEPQKYVDEETFENEVLPALTESIIKKFAIPPEHQEAARKSLAGDYGPECEEFFKTLTPKRLSRFSQVRRQFVTYLRQSLSCRWNERYKLGEDRIAYPARNGKLIPRSQFSALDLILNFTFQANIRTPFEMKHVEDFINALIDDSLSKSQQEFEGSTGFQTYQKFAAMVGGLPQFAELKKEHKEKMLKEINRSPQNRLLFTQGYVLPKLEYFPKKIISYPQLIFNRLHNQGATGTLVENVPSGFKLNFDLKTIFRNLLVLWQKSQDQVFTIPKLEGKPLIDHLFRNFNGGFNVIIDIAGYFRGFSSNEEIASEILRATAGRTPPVDAVGYIDEEGRNVILKRGVSAPVLRSNASIDVDRVFQFYSQEAVIGFDINLSREAKALITSGRFTRRDFFMQGVGRLRGLNTGMVASFVTIDEEMDYIRKNLGLPVDHKMLFKDLFLYCFNLEGEKQGDEAFDVMYHEWLAKIEQLFWDKDLQLSMDERTELFNKLSNFYCQKVFQDPNQMLRLTREELSIDEVSEETLRGLLKTFEKIVAEHPELAEEYSPEKLKEQLAGQFDKGRLREKSTQTRGGGELQLAFSEVEQEDDRDLELEMLQVKNLARDSALYFEPKEPTPLTDAYDELGQYHNVQQFHPESKKFISPNLLCTDNFFKIAEYAPELYRVTMKPARYSLIVQNRKEKTYQVVLLDLHDAQKIYTTMRRDGGRIRREDFDYYLVGNDTMNLLAENGKEKWTRETALEPKLKELMLEARPYTGKLLFDLEDQKRLEEGEMAVPYFKTIEDRFMKPWPYYGKSLDNYSALVL